MGVFIMNTSSNSKKLYKKIRVLFDSVANELFDLNYDNFKINELIQNITK